MQHGKRILITTVSLKIDEDSKVTLVFLCFSDENWSTDQFD